MYGDQVRIVWKHLPLAMHKDAPLAHAASVAAAKQGRFWEFHDKLAGPPGPASVWTTVRTKISVSMLTGSPCWRAPRLVRCSVVGIRATENSGPLTAAMVNETP